MLAWQEGRICLYRAVILRRFGHVCLLGYTRRLGCIVIVIISLRSLWENSKNNELGLFGLVLEGGLYVCVCIYKFQKLVLLWIAVVHVWDVCMYVTHVPLSGF